MTKAEYASSTYGKWLKDAGGIYDICECVGYSLGKESGDG